MTENMNNEVVINDADPEIVYEFLHFLYCGSVRQDLLEKHSDALLALADQYDVEPLKLKCEDVLLSLSLDLDNVMDIYILADSHRSLRLKKKSMHFMKLHMKSLVKHASWKNICRQRADLVADITAALFGDEDVKDSSFTAHGLNTIFSPPS